jgi:hypothetical protein
MPTRYPISATAITGKGWYGKNDKRNQKRIGGLK